MNNTSARFACIKSVPVSELTVTPVTPVTVAAINRAIRYTGLKLITGDGYYYFHDRGKGAQVGESVLVYRAAHLPLDRWILEAEGALEQDRKWRA